jgi:TPR repeat protein
MSAASGKLFGKNLYAFCSKNGRGVAKAEEGYRVAAGQRWAVAQYNYGFCFEQGEGVAKNVAEAARYYTIAAGQGDAQEQQS